MLQSGDPAPFREALLTACVENLQYDRQWEEDRTPYMMRLLDLAGLRDAAREAILQALPATEEGWDRDWMVDLLGAFASDGDAPAWHALLVSAQGGNERAQDRLASSSDEGLEWVAEHVLPGLSLEDRWRLLLWLPDEEEDDRTPTQRSLRAVRKQDVAIYEKNRMSARSDKPLAREFLREIAAGKSPRMAPHEFARIAKPREFRQAAEALLKADDARVAWRTAGAFRRRAFPLSAHRLFPHATHEERGGTVCRILGTIDAPSVRHFARCLLNRRPLPWNAIEALTASFRPGDEALVARVLPDVEGDSNTDRHSVVLDVVALFREHPSAAWQPHAEWVYDHSPCSMCRASAVDWMADHGALPPVILREIPYDAEPEIRKVGLAREPGVAK